jgi:hypothetical protein
MSEPHSLHAEVVDAVSRLDERDGPVRVRDLLYAEAACHNVPASTVEMTSAVHLADGGIDGFTEFPFAIEAVGIPSGRLVWQVKTGTTKPSATAELGKSAKHQAAQRAVADGASYVLAWLADQPRETSLAVEESFSTEARKLRPDAQVYVLVADDLATWAWHHPQVLLELISLEGLGPIPPLDGTEVENGTTDVEERIRLYLESPMGRALRIAGPQGSGKSTAIRLAVNTSSRHLDVVIARDPSGASANMLTKFAHRKIDVGVIIERCTPEQAAPLEHLVEASDNHLRLITEGVEPGRSYFQKTDLIEVKPMMANMDWRLLGALGLPPPLQMELRGSTGGNPMLLSALARGEQALSEDVVRRLTDGLDVRALASFALMPPLGADQPHLELVASASGVLIETLEDTATALADCGLIVGAAYPRLPAALAAASLRETIISRRTWLGRLLEHLPDGFVFAALGPLATVGSAAQPFVVGLLERADVLLARPDDEISAYDLLDRLGVAIAAIPAAPVDAARRLNEIARQFPWAEQPGLALVAASDLMNAAKRLDQMEVDETAGARLVLEVIAASGSQHPTLRTTLRSMLGLTNGTGNNRTQSIRRIAEGIDGHALAAFTAAMQP